MGPAGHCSGPEQQTAEWTGRCSRVVVAGKIETDRVPGRVCTAYPGGASAACTHHKHTGGFARQGGCGLGWVDRQDVHTRSSSLAATWWGRGRWPTWGPDLGMGVGTPLDCSLLLLLVQARSLRHYDLRSTQGRQVCRGTPFRGARPRQDRKTNGGRQKSGQRLYSHTCRHRGGPLEAS